MNTATFRETVAEAVSLFFAPVIAVASAFGKVVDWRLEDHDHRAAAAASQDLTEKAERTLVDAHHKIVEEMELQRVILEQMRLQQQQQLQLQYSDPLQQQQPEQHQKREKTGKRAVVAA